MSVYAVVTDDGIDQIVETLALANRERKDLIAMGCNAKIKQFDNEDSAYKWQEKAFGIL